MLLLSRPLPAQSSGFERLWPPPLPPSLQLALVFSLQREIGLCTTLRGNIRSRIAIGIGRGACERLISLPGSLALLLPPLPVVEVSVITSWCSVGIEVALSLAHVEGRTDHTPERRDLRGPCQHVARHCTPRKGEPRGGVRRVCDKPILTLRSARNAPAVCAHRQLLAPELRRIDHVDAHAYVVARKPINLNHDTRVRPREGLAKQTNTMRR